MALNIRYSNAQLAKVRASVANSQDNVLTLIVEDSQPAASLVDLIIETGVDESEVQLFRGLRGDVVVDEIVAASQKLKWAVLEIGGWYTTPGQRRLIQYMQAQPLGRPRVLVVVGDLDYECATEELQALVAPTPICDLRSLRSENYFFELLGGPISESPQVARFFARFQVRVLALEMPEDAGHLRSFRVLARAASMAGSGDLADMQFAIKLCYLAGLGPDDSSIRDAIRTIAKEELGLL